MRAPPVLHGALRHTLGHRALRRPPGTRVAARAPLGQCPYASVSRRPARRLAFACCRCCDSCLRAASERAGRRRAASAWTPAHAQARQHQHPTSNPERAQNAKAAAAARPQPAGTVAVAGASFSLFTLSICTARSAPRHTTKTTAPPPPARCNPRLYQPPHKHIFGDALGLHAAWAQALPRPCSTRAQSRSAHNNNTESLCSCLCGVFGVPPSCQQRRV
jgi:hypothetical protein